MLSSCAYLLRTLRLSHRDSSERASRSAAAAPTVPSPSAGVCFSASSCSAVSLSSSCHMPDSQSALGCFLKQDVEVSDMCNQGNQCRMVRVRIHIKKHVFERRRAQGDLAFTNAFQHFCTRFLTYIIMAQRI